MIRVVAAIAIICGLLAIAAVLGQHWERAAARREQNDIDAQTYHELAEFVRVVMGAQPFEDPAYIPGWLKAQGQPLLKKISPRGKS